MSPGNGCEEFMTDWSVVCAGRKLTARHRRDVAPQINKLCINISSSKTWDVLSSGGIFLGRVVIFLIFFSSFAQPPPPPLHTPHPPPPTPTPSTTPATLLPPSPPCSWRLFAAVTHFTWWLYWGYREWRQIDYLAEQERSEERRRLTVML